MTSISPATRLSIKIDRGKENDCGVQLLHWFLTPIGGWPRSSVSSSVENILSVVLQVICSSLITCVMIPSALSIFLEDNYDDSKARTIGQLSFWILNAFKYCSLILHKGDIRRCVEHMEVDWQLISRAKDRDEMLRAAKIGRLMAGCCAAFMHIGIISYNVVSVLSHEIVVLRNENVSVRVLPYPFYHKIADTYSSPGYEVVFVVQSLTSVIVTTVTVSGCSLAAVFVMHACGQLSILKSWVENFVELDRNGTSTMTWVTLKQKLSAIVEHHLRVLSFISDIEKIMHMICLAEIGECTLHMCLLGYCILTEWDDMDVQTITVHSLIFTSVAVNIFIFCYIGEILSDQCKEIAETAYMTPWYHLSGKMALGLVLIILRSSIIIQLTAGKLIELSIATFGVVLKTSLAYLNMLRAMTT